MLPASSAGIGVLNIGRQDADDVRALALQPARQRVGVVFQLIDDALHLLANLGADVARAVDDSRNGHGRDARELGDIDHAWGDAVWRGRASSCLFPRREVDCDGADFVWAWLSSERLRPSAAS